MPAIVTITTYSDADFRHSFVYTADAVPVNLTGATMRFVARKRAADANSVVLRTETDGIVFANQGTDPGKFTITIPELTLQQMAEGEYQHGLTFNRAGITTKIWNGVLNHFTGVAR